MATALTRHALPIRDIKRGFFTLNLQRSRQCCHIAQAQALPKLMLHSSAFPKRNFARRGGGGGSRSSPGDADFYGLLGLDRNASASDIKKAYFKLAKQYHPDLNPGEEAKEKFAKINNAYETLSDESKRRVYDQTGMTGDEQAQDPFGGQGPFGPGGPFAGGQGFAGFEGFSDQFRRAQGGGQGSPFGDIFDEFEKMFGDQQGGRRQEAQTKGQDIVMNLEIDFMDAVNGA